MQGGRREERETERGRKDERRAGRGREEKENTLTLKTQIKYTE